MREGDSGEGRVLRKRRNAKKEVGKVVVELKKKASIAIGRKKTKKNNDEKRETEIISKLKSSVLSRIAALNNNPSSSSSAAAATNAAGDEASSFLHDRLRQIFGSFHTPSHPPYALMIKRAIRELNEEGGSTEEEISKFIKKEYEDLPWAHVSILDIHLRKLCLDEDLKRTQAGRYMLLIDDAIGNMEETECKRSKRIRKKTGEVIGKDNRMQNQEQTLASEFHGAGANNRWMLVKVPDWREQHGKSEMQQPQMLQIEQGNQSQGQGIGANEEHHEALRWSLRSRKSR